MELLARDSLRIVHIDDDPDFVLLSERSLKKAGFKQPVVRCPDGVLALHYFATMEAEAAPHVILLDFHMPNMNGLEVVQWVRHSYSERDVAIYLLTSSQDPLSMRRAVAAGVTDILCKNPMLDELIEKLDALIAKSNLQRQEAEAKNRKDDLPPAGEFGL
jgi:two-component system, OmpR family, phosphate regulon response regulator PhoB